MLSRLSGLFFLLISSHFLMGQNVEELKLKDFRPKSIYKIPQTTITKARFPIIDMHTHTYPNTDQELDAWVKIMDRAGIEKSIILSYATGVKFDSIYARYSRYGERFEVWCGIDYTGSDRADWSAKAIKEMERCHKVGARGVGELGDKGLGELYSKPTPGYGVHINDPRLKPVLKRCGELEMPISIHVAEPMWMYEPMDSTNDGLMNSYIWRVDQTKKGLLDHSALIGTLEDAARQNPGTTFIACHLANCEYDLEILGKLFDQYPNLYADIAARFGEIAPIPRYMISFFDKYQDRLVYGTDWGNRLSMYQSTFRILETLDEHFYLPESGYHWPCSGFGLSDQILEKLYRGNARKILKSRH